MIDTETQSAANPPVLDGSWERPNRSPIVAAILALLGVGAIYFNAQSLMMVPVMIVSNAFEGANEFSGDLLERMGRIFEQLALPIQIILVISQYLFMLVPAWWLVRRLHSSQPWSYMRLRGVSVIEIVLAVAITLAVIPFSTFIADEITRFFDIPEWFANLGVQLFTAHSPVEFVWLVLVIAVTPAICEEALFRGYAQRTLERKYGAKAFWIVGFIFGLYHMNPIGLISLSLLGIIFGYFAYRSKSMLPGMAAHFTNNFFVVLLLYTGMEIGGVDLVALERIPLWMVGASALATAVLLLLYHLVTQKKIGSEELPISESEPQSA
ncbi:MAG: hypothetical protein CL946_01840 [Ectothiorhodospiraceae bacterium]|nr:hypothetical protein [Ectothiorhodospiraceae bacterium]